MVTSLLVLSLASLQVLDRAHSHNDYAQARPLQEALDNGFASVEVDIYYTAGRFFVGHNREDLKMERSLDSLYLKPLAAYVNAHKGWVYPHKTLWLLIDIKNHDDPNTFFALQAALKPYPQLRSKAVRLILSGERPIGDIVHDKGRFAALDGRWPDLDKGYSKELMPWISESWSDHFKWQGEGQFPASEQALLKEMVKKVHDQRRKLRFWGAPDTEAIWQVQWDAGVDWINTDHLSALRKWMLSRR